MRQKWILPLVIILSLSFGQAEAQRRFSTASRHSRIRQGVRSGELTRAEVMSLSRRERGLRRDMRRAKADGVITPGERRRINREQRRLNRSIIRMKHNKRDRNF